LARLRAALREQVRLELLVEELVVLSLIDQ